MMMIHQKVLRYIRENRLNEGRKTLVAGVSGGPDSVCLLHVLYSLREEMGVSIHVAHLDHKLRGEESDGDAAYVAGLAMQLGLPVTVGERDVNEYRAVHGGTLEEAAREVRYDFFAQITKELGTDCVVTGHTLDDNIETILMHLVRGTGTRGLTGLKPETELKSGAGTVRIIRPLLELTREETVAYCREYDLQPRQDSSNESLSPLRNRVRQQLLPLLEGYNEGIRDALLRVSDVAAEETDYLDGVVAGVWDAVAEEKEGNVILDKEKLIELHPALQRRVFRKAVELVLGTLKDIETRHIAVMMEGLQLQPGKELHLPDGLVFTVEYDRYLLSVQPDTLVPFPELDGEYPLTVPGTTSIPGWDIFSSVCGDDVAINADDPFTAFFDFDKTGDSLTVRSRMPADRFQPLGTDYMKKVGEYMIDARIPRLWRDRIPLVCTPSQIIWLAGYRPDDRVKVTPETQQILRITFRQL